MKAPKPYKARGRYQKVVKLVGDNYFVMFKVNAWPGETITVPPRNGMTWHHSIFADQIAGHTISIQRKGSRVVRNKEIVQTYYV